MTEKFNTISMLQMLVASPVTSGQGIGHASSSSAGQCGEYNKRYAKLHEGLETSVSIEGKSRVERILNEVQILSDVEKLLLYLKLPTGIPKDEYLRSTPPSCLPASNRREQGEAMTWIRSHLEEHGDVCMPKAEVYEEYKQYCVQHELRHLCNADFGKVMKTVFPDINTRRLGQRGQSKYFYGGLRKKLEHAQPGLPELEIQSKGTEADSETADTEVFKASCQLVCEWADKLLDNKFLGIQSIAEHLVSSMYVNTKSVAAFTLIAAMQETGNLNLKGSALFSTQTHNTMDKHKETNLLLQQKLHKNKVLQKQKEKLQAMKEENAQKEGSAINTSPDQRTSSMPQSKKSNTPSKMAKTPKLQSPRASPCIAKALQKDFRSTGTTSNEQMVTESLHEPNESNLDLLHISQSQYQLSHCEQNIDMVSDQQGSASDTVYSGKSIINKTVSVTEDVTMEDMSDRNDKTKSVSTAGGILTRTSIQYKSANTLNITEPDIKSSRETPYTEMEQGSNTLTHVRKISFDDIGEKSLELVVKNDNKTEQNNVKSTEDCKSAKVEMLSKSAGHLSLKMLLERKDTSMSSLNKSTGLLEKSKTNLLVSQSNVPGRSAFVPFAQVQQPRRDSSDTSQPPSSIIPINIPSSSEKSSLPGDDPANDKQQGTSEVLSKNSAFGRVEPHPQSSQKITESVLKFFPSSAVQLTASLDGRALVAQPTLNLAGSESLVVGSMKDSLTILTASSSLSTSSNAETMVSASQHSPGISKHLRTRFTPIRPKGSPSKATKEKIETPVYDKRPVSEILKEKRAKEQAEVVAKLHAGMNLPTIPFQPSLSLGNGNFGGLQQIQGVTGKDVVIIVNNQTGQNLQNLVNQTSLFTQPAVQTKADEKPKGDSNIHQFEDTTTANHVMSNAIPDTREGNGENGFEPGKLILNESRTDCIDVVSLIEDDEPQPASASSEMDVEEGGVDVKSPLQDNTNEALPSIDQEKRDKFEQIYTETPAKIARLNITSPFRPDSACSVGRETPFRLTKQQEPCSSRPESACSFGRETPSGARKRKSSDYQQRKDFKRLNSTGDEGDDVMIEKGLTELLSPSSESQQDLHRRTQSCTFELDKDIRRNIPLQSKAVILPEGLQSPDILSLEEEALIESYPNSLFAMRPNKSQRHSIGVSARSVKASQQRLLKQKQILDKQVGSFLQQSQDSSESLQSVPSGKDGSRRQSDFKVPQQQQEIVKDGSSVQVDVGISQMNRQGTRFESEPSGLPSDVADWINETIEKRQILNQSVLSEPELGVLNPQRASTAIDFAVPNFNFEVDHNIRARSSLSSVQSERNHQRGTSSKPIDNNTFTVPKPPLTLKVKDGPAKSDVQTPSQRCQSLPMFTSMTKSPVSPLPGSSNKHPLYQRGVSMSPRQQPSESPAGQTNLLSPVSGLTSPLRRIEVRDNHPISVSIHSSSSNMTPLAKLREEGSSLNDGKPTHSINDDHRNQMRSYLASIQHSLQKPKDSVSKEMESNKSRDKGFVMPPAKLILGPKSSANLSSSPQTNQDNTFNMSQFSDSGYQSSGPSPICNTVPSTLGLRLDAHQGRITTSVLESPSSSGGLDITKVSIVDQSTFPHTGERVSEETVKLSQTVINSSKHSAFIPIQSSNQNVQFIAPTPIRPTVSLPSQVLQLAQSVPTLSSQLHLSVERNQSEMSQDFAMISPKGHDPPPYEAAVKSLRQPNQHSSQLDNANVSNNLQNKGFSPSRDPIVTETCGKERVSLLANMGKESAVMHQESFGPFASKLVQLSKQTKSTINQKPGEVSGVRSTYNPTPQGDDKTILLLTPCATNTAPPTANVQLTPDTQLMSQNDVEVEDRVNERVNDDASSIKELCEPSNDVISKYSEFLANKVVGHYQSVMLNDDCSDNYRQTGAKVLMSPNNEQDLQSFNMEIDFLQSPSSQPFIQSSSSSSSQFTSNTPLPTNPSHLSASNGSHSAYKNISDPHLSSIIHSHNSTGADVIPSNIQNQLECMLHPQEPDQNNRTHVKDVNMGEELPREANHEQLMSYSDRDNQMTVLDTRSDFPVDLDLMLQDLKDLERHLLQGHEGLNLD